MKKNSFWKINTLSIKKMCRKFYWIFLEKPLATIFYYFPIKKNRFVFDNFGGKGYGDNPKYIAEAIYQLDNNIEMIWLIDNLSFFEFPSYIHPTKIDSIRALYLRATAKVWIDNIRHRHPVKKKKNQIYVQTWHGPFSLKCVEKEAESQLNETYIKEAMYDGSITDGILANSKLQEIQYKQSFWLNEKTEILKFGLPRNDYLINMSSETFQKEIRKKFNFCSNHYYVLYAPTFRDDYSTKGYALEFEKIRKVFENVMGCPCTIVVRLHPNASFQKKEISFTDKIIDGNIYPDMQELVLACDAIISDYSSSIFDFAVLNKLVMICALDLEDYEKNRGLLKWFYKLPFPMATTNEELISNIKEYNKEEYESKVSKYLKEYPVYDDGNASELTAKWILDKVNKTQNK